MEKEDHSFSSSYSSLSFLLLSLSLAGRDAVNIIGGATNGYGRTVSYEPAAVTTKSGRVVKRTHARSDAWDQVTPLRLC